MRVVAFSDQYEQVAPLYGLSPAELRARDDAHPFTRWVAFEGEAAIAAVVARVRPDGRTFLSFANEELPFDPLVEAASTGTGGPVHAGANDDVMRQTLEAIGFEVEVAMERFRVRFPEPTAGVETVTGSMRS